jgi:hypothetical protein
VAGRAMLESQAAAMMLEKAAEAPPQHLGLTG